MLLRGKPNYSVTEMKEYLKEKNSQTEFASKEEIEEAIKEINKSIDEIK